MAGRQPKEKRSTLSLYIASAFVLTAAMTVLVVAGAIIVVWNMNHGFMLSERDVYRALIAGGCIALVIATVLGLLFANGIAQPIARISEAAASLRDGKLSARTGLHGDDELATLGETFDDMAESIERDRDLERQLIGDVAHELRTPLMAIQATVEAIQDGVFPADEEHLSTVQSETRRLGRLVEALLHLNRLENGTIVAKQERVDLTQLVEELTLAHEALIESSGLALSTDVAPGVVVNGDHDLLLQAVSNLLSNAVRYTPEGGQVEVVLSCEDGYACIAVSDTGVGIAEEDLDKVFSRFWRADSARSRVGGGLGVGLALVKEVADQHRGHVSVNSVLGEGSTFCIYVPLAYESLLQGYTTSQRSAEREARRVAKAARKEEDRLRKEEEKLKKLQEREQKQAQKAEEKARKAGSTLSFPTIRFK